VDSYCLQSIVLDEDRRKLIAAVRARLKTDGHYLISTAMFEADRRYDDAIYDEQTGIVYSRLDEVARQYREVEGLVQIAGASYVPHRRHLKPAALAAELQRADFRILCQGGQFGGDVICTRKGRRPS
jgi:hypothetical protein